MECDDTEKTTCDLNTVIQHDKQMIVYKGCTQSSGSTRVTLYCCDSARPKYEMYV